jgi:predicted nucleic acid-binding protein
VGADTTRQAVTDAGPLIHLNEIGSLSLLYVFDEIHVTDTVWAEATMPNRVATTHLTALAHLRKHRATRNDMARFIVGANLSLLHLGEQTSLYLSHRLGVDLILTDDLAAREAAKSMGLRPVGSLGVIARACANGLLDVESATSRMRDLQKHSTLFVTDQIVEFAIETLHRQLKR